MCRVGKPDRPEQGVAVQDRPVEGAEVGSDERRAVAGDLEVRRGDGVVVEPHVAVRAASDQRAVVAETDWTGNRTVDAGATHGRAGTGCFSATQRARASVC